MGNGGTVETPSWTFHLQKLGQLGATHMCICGVTKSEIDRLGTGGSFLAVGAYPMSIRRFLRNWVALAVVISCGNEKWTGWEQVAAAFWQYPHQGAYPMSIHRPLRNWVALAVVISCGNEELYWQLHISCEMVTQFPTVFRSDSGQVPYCK